MAEIRLKKRYKYAGDIFQGLVENAGFQPEVAAALLNDIPDADVAPRAEVARELITIIEQRLSNNANRRRGTGSEFWFGIYEGREDAYKDIKEIIEQKYLEGEK